MSDELEDIFFYQLRLITTLLLKQGAAEHRQLLPLVQEYEEDRWDSLPGSEKYQRVDAVRDITAPGTSLANQFTEFPHEWTKIQFLDFIDTLNLYCGSLRHGIR
jgi:hypothetical protein